MLLYYICKYTYYKYILLKINQTLSYLLAIVIMTAKSVDLCQVIQVHSTFIIQYVINTLIMLWFKIQLSYPSNNVTPKLFVFLLVINYFTNYWLDYIFNHFHQQEKLFKCLVSLQLYTQKKIIVNLYQKQLLGCFSEYIKCGHLISCWIGIPVTGCCSTYM